MHYVIARDRHGRRIGELCVDERKLLEEVWRETPYTSTDILKFCAAIAHHFYGARCSYVQDSWTGECAIAHTRGPS